jgi:hypothetical protein
MSQMSRAARVMLGWWRFLLALACCCGCSNSQSTSIRAQQSSAGSTRAPTVVTKISSGSSAPLHTRSSPTMMWFIREAPIRPSPSDDHSPLRISKVGESFQSDASLGAWARGIGGGEWAKLADLSEGRPSGYTPGPPENAPRDEWRDLDSASEMDGSQGASAVLDSDNWVEGFLARYKPTLYIRCKEHKTDVFVVTGMPAAPELGLFSRFTIRLRFDEGKPSYQEWSGATDGQALFAQSAPALARRMSSARIMRFEFTPYNASPQIATFHVEGLKNHLPKVAKACGWKK